MINVPHWFLWSVAIGFLAVVGFSVWVLFAMFGGDGYEE